MCNCNTYYCTCEIDESPVVVRIPLWEMEPGTKFSSFVDGPVYTKLNAGTKTIGIHKDDKIHYCGSLPFCDKIFCIDNYFSIIEFDKDLTGIVK